MLSFCTLKPKCEQAQPPQPTRQPIGKTFPTRCCIEALGREPDIMLPGRCPSYLGELGPGCWSLSGLLVYTYSMGALCGHWNATLWLRHARMAPAVAKGVWIPVRRVRRTPLLYAGTLSWIVGTVCCHTVLLYMHQLACNDVGSTPGSHAAGPVLRAPLQGSHLRCCHCERR